MIRFEMKLPTVFNFYRTCVEVAILASTHLVAK